MVNEQDRSDLADLAMRALDTIEDDYGENAELAAASLVFEVRVQGQDDAEPLFHGNYKSLERNSPHHIAGLLYATGQHIMAPEANA
jgi:hypothetical protein